MHWIYLSPHLDDIALSCGGLVWEQTQAGDHVEIWTICAGDPPEGALSPFAESLHARWGTDSHAAAHRRAEDIESCRVMGAVWRHDNLLDCIYRVNGAGQHLYASEQALFDPVHPEEAGVVASLAQKIAQAPGRARIVCPLALVGHVDHRLTRAAAEQSCRRLWYYADYPYVLHSGDPSRQLRQLRWRRSRFPISGSGLLKWMAAVAAHGSQISTFWPDLGAMETAIQDYCRQMSGVALWRGNYRP